jgi:hypothetical protein
MSYSLKTKKVPAIKRNFVSSTQYVTFPTNQTKCLRFDYKSLAHKMDGWSEDTVLNFTELGILPAIETYIILQQS